MKLPDVKKYANELAGLINERDAGAGATDKITAIMRAANAKGERQQELALEKQRAVYAKQVSVLEAEVLAVSKARDIEGARQLLVDIEIRIDEALKAYVDWRKMVNQYEYSVEHGEFAAEPEAGTPPTGFTRSMADLELDKSKAYAEARVKFAADLVPNRTVVLL